MSHWDDPDNPVVDMVESGPMRGINIRQRDVEMAEMLGLPPKRCAIARQPLMSPVQEFDWAPSHERMSPLEPLPPERTP